MDATLSPARAAPGAPSYFRCNHRINSEDIQKSSKHFGCAKLRSSTSITVRSRARRILLRAHVPGAHRRVLLEFAWQWLVCRARRARGLREADSAGASGKSNKRHCISGTTVFSIASSHEHEHAARIAGFSGPSPRVCKFYSSNLVFC
jgi:hypothetical protein